MEKCRICLSVCATYISLSEVHEGLPLSVIAMVICPIKIEESDNFPKIICQFCSEVLLTAYRLRDTSNQSDRYLRDHEKVFEESKCDPIVKQEKNPEDENLHFEQSIFAQPVESSEENCTIASMKPKAKSVQRFDSGHSIKIVKSSRPKRSKVWDFFGKLVDSAGNDVSEGLRKNYCKICWDRGLNVAFNQTTSGATSTMQKHLKEKHGKTTLRTATQTSLKKLTKVSKEPEKRFGSSLQKTEEFNEDGAVNFSPRKNDISDATSASSFTKSQATKEQRDGYKKHSNDKTKSCSECDAKFSCHRSFIKHFKSFHATAKFMCEICSKVYMDNYVLQRHIRFVHNKSTIFKCSLCPAEFSYDQGLQKHLLRHDPKHLGKYKCDMCECKYSEKKTLKTHILTVHLGFPRHRPYPCVDCGKKFRSNGSLKNHSLIHSGERPHQCEYCDATFTQKGDKMRHLQKNHVGDALYSCTIDGCHQSFRFQTELRDHYKVHY